MTTTCPVCGAPIGEACRSPQGVTYASGYVHPPEAVAAARVEVEVELDDETLF